VDVFVISIFMAAIIILFFFLFSRATISGNKSPRHAGYSGKSGSNNPAMPRPAVSNSEESQRVLFARYPGLADITYMPPAVGFSPLAVRELSPEAGQAVNGKIAAIKPIPVNYSALMKILRNPESKTSELSTLAMTNPVLSAKILQTINSAYFHFPDKITAVGRAVTLLGFNNVRALVLQDALQNVIPGEQSGQSQLAMRTWVHSAVVSVCAGYLGKNLLHCSEYELATIGLLHDLGKYFMGLLEPVGEEAPNLQPLAREERRYGMNHAALGSLIADKWQLSDVIVKSIEYHHHPTYLPPESIPEPYRQYSFIINLSDLICKALGYKTGEDELFPVKEEYYTLFQLNPDPLAFISPELVKKIEVTHLTLQSYMAVGDPLAASQEQAL